MWVRVREREMQWWEVVGVRWQCPPPSLCTHISPLPPGVTGAVDSPYPPPTPSLSPSLLPSPFISPTLSLPLLFVPKQVARFVRWWVMELAASLWQTMRWRGRCPLFQMWLLLNYILIWHCIHLWSTNLAYSHTRFYIVTPVFFYSPRSIFRSFEKPCAASG